MSNTYDLMRLFPIVFFALALALLAFFYQADGLPALVFIQEGEPNMSLPPTELQEPEQRSESVLNSRLGLIALILLTAVGALLASQGKRFQAVNRFLRSGSVQE